MKITLDAQGNAVVTNADEGKQNPDGSAAINTWTAGAEQLGKHLRGIANASHPWKTLSAGDKAAAADAAAQFDAAAAAAAQK